MGHWRALVGMGAILVLTGCGFGAAPREAISGVYVATMTRPALLNAGATFAFATSYDQRFLVLELTPDGAYRLARITSLGRGALGEGTYELTASELRLGPDEGPMGCAPLGVQEGRYGWRVEGDSPVLTLTLIEDECKERAYLLNALPWSLSELPYSGP